MGQTTNNQIFSLRTAVSPSTVTLTDRFWQPRLETNRRVTLLANWRKCEETGRIANFARAGGLLSGDHEGIFYNDSDVFKVVEGAAHILATHPDPELDAYLDHVIAQIGAAQEPDGYLYTARTIDPSRMRPDREGAERWSHLAISHELYNVGHLYEAAVAHFYATGKRTLLDVAVKNADLIDAVFGPNGRYDVPGHPEIELALVKLSQATGEPRYWRLAHFFLQERGRWTNGRLPQTFLGNPGYMQDHQPLTEQREAIGHAVRAAYLYCGMADIALLTGDEPYRAALDQLWHSVVGQKMYLTGGIGAHHHGEAFGAPYELPNATAYCETCAAIGNILWNWRLFLLHGHARYLDVVERTLYNGFLAGVGFSGDQFFYPNPLASDGVTKFNIGLAATRQPWFQTACCPTNVVRFLPQLPGLVYALADKTIYVGLYVTGETAVSLPHGPRVQLRQQTDYPWHGEILLTVSPEKAATFTLKLRLPGWAQGQPVPSDLYRYWRPQPSLPQLLVNDQPHPVLLEDGFIHIHRRWQPGDRVSLTLPMPVQRVLSHPAVTENQGRVALERGPLVYCAEGVDNEGRLSELSLADTAPLTTSYEPDLLNGVVVIRGGGLTAVPYYPWSHRGEGEMAVWLPRHAD